MLTFREQATRAGIGFVFFARVELGWSLTRHIGDRFCRARRQPEKARRVPYTQPVAE